MMKQRKCPSCGMINVGSFAACLGCGTQLPPESPPPVDQRRCRVCGAALLEDPAVHFCMACGARIARACAGCSRELPAGARFCPFCGAPQAP